MATLTDLTSSSPTNSPRKQVTAPAGGSEKLPSPAAGPRSPFRLGLLIAAVVLLAAIGIAIWSRMHQASELKRATLAAVAVTVNVVHPSSVAMADEVSLPGTAKAFMDTPIYARTSGYLSSWSVDIGDRVKRGQTLAQIEAPEVDQQLEQARADLKNAEANLYLSQITSERAEGLFKRNTISAQERDQATSDLAAKQALVDSGKANVRRLEELKGFEQVTAPFDGVITARNTDVGALIQAGDATGAVELFHLTDNHILRVYFSVPEIYAATVKPGATVQIGFDAFPGEKFHGTISRDAASLDPRTHTLLVEADVENESNRLFPGGYATVHLKFPATPGAVTIPANTLLFRAEGIRVALVRDGRVALTPINIGRDYGNTLEVVGGLTTKDSVVLDPPDSLAEGDAVVVESDK